MTNLTTTAARIERLLLALRDSLDAERVSS